MKTAKQKFSRLLSVALVFLLALTAAVPVFAAPVENENQQPLTITIKNNEGLPEMTADQFTAYQLFTGTPNKEDAGTPGGNVTKNEWDAKNWNNYTLADINWGKNINGTGLLTGLKATESKQTAWPGFFDAEGNNIIAKYLETPTNKLESAADLAAFLVGKDNAFLQEFSRFVVEGSSTGDKGDGLLIKAGAANSTVTNHTDGKPEEDESSITVDATGYYLIVENGTHTSADAVSEYILAVLGDQVINLKASVPQVDKDIVDGDNGEKGDAAGVGDYIQFKLTGTLPKNFADFDFYKYIFHDTLSKGLTYVKDDPTHPLKVRVYENQAAADADKKVEGGTEIPATYGVDPTNNYAVSETGTEAVDPKCNLEVSFDDLKVLKNATSEPIEVTAESVFVVTYYAKVTKDAVLLSEGNPNTVLLEYSNDPNSDGTGKTKEKKVYVYAFGLDLKKIGSDKPEGLEGAGFVLKDKDGNYAIFENQWVVNDTAADGTKTQTFYTSKEAAETAKGSGEVSGPVRRLTGWTVADSSTKTVKTAIAAYQNAKKDFDKAPSEQQASPDGTAYKALQNAKDALTTYLLESDADGAIPDVYGLDAGDYNLEEVIVPDGYNSPKGDFDIGIQAKINENDGSLESITYTHGTEKVVYKASYTPEEQSALPSGETVENLTAHFEAGLVQDSVENQKAPFLPFTGGIGTLIFYILGIALIAGAVTYLVIAAKKRKKTEENV